MALEWQERCTPGDPRGEDVPGVVGAGGDAGRSPSRRGVGCVYDGFRVNGRTSGPPMGRPIAMKAVMLSDGPMCGTVISIRDASRSVQIPEMNPRCPDEWEPPDPDVRWRVLDGGLGIVAERLNRETGEWVEVPRFLAMSYRDSGETTTEGMPIFRWEG